MKQSLQNHLCRIFDTCIGASDVIKITMAFVHESLPFFEELGLVFSCDVIAGKIGDEYPRMPQNPRET